MRPRPVASSSGTSTSSVSATSALSSSASSAGFLKLHVARGLIPSQLFGLLFFALPMVDYYTSFDTTDTHIRAVVIALGVVAPTLLIVANDYVAWFTIALYFHVGMEVRAIDALVDYAGDGGTADHASILAYSAAAAIGLHIVPFFLSDRCSLLTFFAWLGVVVNTSSLVFVVDSDQVMLTSLSALGLLGVVVMIACIPCVKTSLPSQLRQARQEGVCHCLPYVSGV